MHAHRPADSRDLPYRGPVTDLQSVRARSAQGNICRRDECRCGAVRFTNINGNARERGAWVEPS